ncbi:MAG: MFS transporter [Armatimonadetes bacterium]|nr:MFS transporter [Armatimonadota bacterium]
MNAPGQDFRPEAPSPPLQSPALIVAACCFAMLSIGTATNLPALCLTSIAADVWGMDVRYSGLFLSCYFWGLVASIMASGPLADRLGFRYLLASSALFPLGGMLMVSAAHAGLQALAGSAVVGFGSGISDALLTPLACAAYPRERVRIANLLHAFYPIGMLAAVLGVLLLMSLGWDWRAIYRLMAMTSIPYGIVFLLVALPRHSHEGEERLPGRQLLRQPMFLVFLALIFLAGLSELGPAQWLPAYVEQAAGGSKTSGAFGLLFLGVMMTLGRFANSALSHKISARRLVAAGGAFSLVTLVLAALPGPTYLTLIWLGLLGLSFSGLWPTILSISGDRFPQAGASMYSLLHACGNMGGLVGPLTVGLIAKGYGLRAGMASLTLAPLLIMALCAWEKKRG